LIPETAIVKPFYLREHSENKIQLKRKKKIIADIRAERAGFLGTSPYGRTRGTEIGAAVYPDKTGMV